MQNLKKTSSIKVRKTLKAKSVKIASNKMRLKADINKMQNVRPEITTREPVKRLHKTSLRGDDINRKVYLKAGIGKGEYEKFKEKKDGGYEKKTHGNTVYNMGIGYNFTNSIRADLNLEYTQSKYKANGDSPYGGSVNVKQNIKTMAIFINGYYDINFHKSFVPYITAGIGISQNKTSDMPIEMAVATARGRKQNNFIWNAGVGLQYKFTDNFALDLSYKYVDLGYIKTDDAKTGSRTTDIFRIEKQKLKGHQGLSTLSYYLKGQSK